jgi:chromosome partitioning protein
VLSKIITVAQQKGGAGKTTLAAHLAVALMQKGKRVAVIDIDPQGSLSMWHKLRTERFGEGYTGINHSTTSGWRVGSEISFLKNDYDFIIIDSPPHTETEAKSAIRAADLVLIPVQPSPTDLWATQAVIDIAEREHKLIGVLLNRVPPNSKLAKEITNNLSHLMSNSLGNRVSFVSCLLDGKGVTESDPNSIAAKEIKAITEEILSFFPISKPQTKKKYIREEELA